MLRILSMLVFLVAIVAAFAGTSGHARAQSVPFVTPQPYVSQSAQTQSTYQAQGGPVPAPTEEPTPDPNQIITNFFALQCDASSAFSNALDTFVSDVTSPGVTIGRNSYSIGIYFLIACGGFVLIMFIYRFGAAFNVEDFFQSGGAHVFFLLMILAFLAYASGVKGGTMASVQAENSGAIIASKLIGRVIPANVGGIIGTGVCRAWQTISIPMLAELKANPQQAPSGLFDIKAAWGNTLALLNYLMIFVLALIPALEALLAHVVLAVQQFMLHINAYLVAPAAVFTIALAIVPMFKDHMPKYMGVLYLIVVSEIALILDLGIINTLFDFANTQIVQTIQTGAESGLVLRLIELNAIGIVALGLAIAAPQFAKVFVGQLGEFGGSFAAAGFLGTALGLGAMGASFKLAQGSISAIGNSLKGLANKVDRDVKVHSGNDKQRQHHSRTNAEHSEGSTGTVDAEAKPVRAPSHSDSANHEAQREPAHASSEQHDEAPIQSGSIFDSDHVATMESELTSTAEAEINANARDTVPSSEQSPVIADGSRANPSLGSLFPDQKPNDATRNASAPTTPAHYEADMRLGDAIEAIAATPTAATAREFATANAAATHRTQSQRQAMGAIANTLQHSSSIAPTSAAGKRQLIAAQGKLGEALRAVSGGDHAIAKRYLQDSERSFAAIAASPQTNELTRVAAGETMQNLSQAYQAVGVDHIESLRAAPSYSSGQSSAAQSQQTIQQQDGGRGSAPYVPTTPQGVTRESTRTNETAQPPDQSRTDAQPRTDARPAPTPEPAHASAAGDTQPLGAGTDRLSKQLEGLQKAFERNTAVGESANRQQKLRSLRQKLKRVFEEGATGFGSLTPPGHSIEHPTHSIPRRPSK